MSNWSQARGIYESASIPAELKDRVNAAIEYSKSNEGVIIKHRVFVRICAGTAAAVFICVVILLNTNAAFARAMGEIPVLGPVARIFTFREYQEEEWGGTISVKIPEISTAETEEKAFAEKINAQIQEKVEARIKEAKQRLKEYKEAFLETGGTEKQFNEKNLRVQVDYEIKSQEGSRLSFVVTSAEQWEAYTERCFYNLDVAEGKEIRLWELLGESYIEIANESIRRQMKERMEADPDILYFDEKDGGFRTIDKNTQFYINASGNPVIVFPKYETAPGFMGAQEFEIKRTE